LGESRRQVWERIGDVVARRADLPGEVEVVERVQLRALKSRRAGSVTTFRLLKTS